MTDLRSEYKVRLKYVSVITTSSSLIHTPLTNSMHFTTCIGHEPNEYRNQKPLNDNKDQNIVHQNCDHRNSYSNEHRSESATEYDMCGSEPCELRETQLYSEINTPECKSSEDSSKLQKLNLRLPASADLENGHTNEGRSRRQTDSKQNSSRPKSVKNALKFEEDSSIFFVSNVQKPTKPLQEHEAKNDHINKRESQRQKSSDQNPLRRKSVKSAQKFEENSTVPFISNAQRRTTPPQEQEAENIHINEKESQRQKDSEQIFSHPKSAKSAKKFEENDSVPFKSKVGKPTKPPEAHEVNSRFPEYNKPPYISQNYPQFLCPDINPQIKSEMLNGTAPQNSKDKNSIEVNHEISDSKSLKGILKRRTCESVSSYNPASYKMNSLENNQKYSLNNISGSACNENNGHHNLIATPHQGILKPTNSSYTIANQLSNSITTFNLRPILKKYKTETFIPKSILKNNQVLIETEERSTDSIKIKSILKNPLSSNYIDQCLALEYDQRQLPNVETTQMQSSIRKEMCTSSILKKPTKAICMWPVLEADSDKRITLNLKEPSVQSRSPKQKSADEFQIKSSLKTSSKTHSFKANLKTDSIEERHFKDLQEQSENYGGILIKFQQTKYFENSNSTVTLRPNTAEELIIKMKRPRTLTSSVGSIPNLKASDAEQIAILKDSQSYCQNLKQHSNDSLELKPIQKYDPSCTKLILKDSEVEQIPDLKDFQASFGELGKLSNETSEIKRIDNYTVKGSCPKLSLKDLEVPKTPNLDGLQGSFGELGKRANETSEIKGIPNYTAKGSCPKLSLKDLELGNPGYETSEIKRISNYALNRSCPKLILKDSEAEQIPDLKDLQGGFEELGKLSNGTSEIKRIVNHTVKESYSKLSLKDLEVQQNPNLNGLRESSDEFGKLSYETSEIKGIPYHAVKGSYPKLGLKDLELGDPAYETSEIKRIANHMPISSCPKHTLKDSDVGQTGDLKHSQATSKKLGKPSSSSLKMNSISEHFSTNKYTNSSLGNSNNAPSHNFEKYCTPHAYDSKSNLRNSFRCTYIKSILRSNSENCLNLYSAFHSPSQRPNQNQKPIASEREQLLMAERIKDIERLPNSNSLHSNGYFSDDTISKSLREPQYRRDSYIKRSKVRPETISMRICNLSPELSHTPQIRKMELQSQNKH